MKAVARTLAKTLGGTWFHPSEGVWNCSDGRTVKRCRGPMIDWQTPGPDEWWLISKDGRPQRAEQYLNLEVSQECK